MSEREPMTLSQLRRHRGMNQADLAEATGYTQQWISDIEHTPIGSLSVRALRGYLEGMGGKLRLVVSFEDGEQYDLRERVGH